MPDDLTLVSKVATHHDRHAFDLLVRKYQSPVRRFLLNLTLGNEALSDDLAQDTFVKAYMNIGQFRATATFQTWLFRIAYNVFYDNRRHAARGEQHEVSVESTPAAAMISSRGTSADAAMDVHHALALLKDEERTCITLQLIDGEPIDQIALITGMPENTVKSHLRRGKVRLTNYLKQNGYG